MAKLSFVKINIRGGILSSGDLRSIVNIIKDTANSDSIELGERQNIYFKFEKNRKEKVEEALTKALLDFEIDNNQFPNIISSYAAEGIFSTHSWLGEGHYRDILYSFTFRPKIKINISDNTQALVPLYTGCLNFIPSSHINFFHLYINHPAFGGLKSWNKLVYSTDIATLAESIEKAIHTEQPLELSALSKQMDRQHKFISIESNEELKIPRIRFPYYEGMNKYGDRFWLGIYRRNNDFSIGLLESILNLCTQTRIGQINLTPWKSIMVKGIVESERIEWEKLLSIHGINSRHSSLELNWQLADRDAESLRIKNDLVKIFDEEDIRTYGISFAIDTGKKIDISSSVVIKKRPGIFNFWGFFKKLTVYDIRYAPDFSLSATTHVTYTTNITWNGLAMNLRNLSENFYKQLSENAVVKNVPKEERVLVATHLYQCKHCYTTYDEKCGEPQNGIPMGTSFNQLTEDYKCPLCESHKADFVKKDLEICVS